MMTISYFPKPYNNELLYSVIARYLIHTLTLDYKVILDELFGKRTVVATVDFPSHLNKFCAHISSCLDIPPNDVLENHTLFPIYKPFLPNQRLEKIKASCLSEYGGNIHTRLGNAASGISYPKWLKVCPECMSEQKQTHGEYYWQRELQLKGVEVCPYHNIFLFKTNISYHPLGKHTFIPLTKYVQLSKNEFHENEKQKLFTLSRMYLDILKSNLHKPLSYEHYSIFYKNLAEEFGYTKGRNVKHDEIKCRVISYWGKDLLLKLDPYLSKLDQWLIPMFQKHRKAFQPIQHIIVWQAFGLKSFKKDIYFKWIKKSRAKKSPQKVSVGSQLYGKDKQRAQWLKILSDYPELGVKKIRTSIAGALYTWLYRNDRQWLKEHTPKRKKININTRVDWESRDLEVLADLITLEEKARHKYEGPRRSVTWFTNGTKHRSYLLKNLNKLPSSKEFIEKHSESIKDYQKRRIKYVLQTKLQNENEIKLWQVMRLAGLRKSNFDQEMIDFITCIAKEECRAVIPFI